MSHWLWSTCLYMLCEYTTNYTTLIDSTTRYSESPMCFLYVSPQVNLLPYYSHYCKYNYTMLDDMITSHHYYKIPSSHSKRCFARRKTLITITACRYTKPKLKLYYNYLQLYFNRTLCKQNYIISKLQLHCKCSVLWLYCNYKSYYCPISVCYSHDCISIQYNYTINALSELVWVQYTKNES